MVCDRSTVYHTSYHRLSLPNISATLLHLTPDSTLLHFNIVTEPVCYISDEKYPYIQVWTATGPS